MFDFFRRLLPLLLTLAESRLDLFSAELSTEFRRILRAFFWMFFALLFVALAFLMAALTLVIALWEQERLVVSLWVTGGFLALAAFAAFKGWRMLTRTPNVYSRLIDYLRRNRDALSGQRRSSENPDGSL